MTASQRTPAPTERSTHAVVGVVGGGQLARMTHQAAIGLGVELVVLTPGGGDPAVHAGARAVLGTPDRLDHLEALAEGCDVITLDHELVPVDHLRALVEAGHRVRPGPGTLELAQDKGTARQVLAEAGFPTPAFAVVSAGDVAAVDAFAADHGWPVVIKDRTGGYDGRGVHVVADLCALDEVPRGDGWVVEEHLELAQELAVLVVRRPDGRHATYPLVETTQRDGTCAELVLPAVVAPELEDEAIALATALADHLDAVGVLAVELFVVADGRLLVNEVAPRPHNSGHATIDAAATSQFENHLRAVLDLPLGDTSVPVPAAMVNLLGGDAPPALDRLPDALADPRVHVHLYAKAWRPGRKLGHVTALAPTTGEALDAARAAAEILGARS